MLEQSEHTQAEFKFRVSKQNGDVTAEDMKILQKRIQAIATEFGMSIGGGCQIVYGLRVLDTPSDTVGL